MKNITKISTNNRRLFDSSFYGKSVAVLLFFLLIIKQWAIYFSYGGQTGGTMSSQILLFLGFFGSDLMIVGIVLFFIFLGILTENKWLKILFNIINVGLTLVFFTDLITILFFQSRLRLSDIYGFLSFSLTSYFFLYTFLSFLFFVGLSFLSWIISQKFLKKWKKSSYWLSISVVFFVLTLLVTAINFITQNRESFSNNILVLNMQSFAKDYISTRQPLVKKYEDYFTGASGLESKPNIILLFAESLSVVDSKRSGGLYDHFPLFDKMQADGVTFTNFIANGCTSETAHIAVLRGVEPWEYPLIDSNTTYDNYAAYDENLPLFMQDHGYSTLFVSSVTLDFLKQRDFISGLQFQKIVGEEAFKNDKKYVFNAAPDSDLYDKVLDLVNTQKDTKPYFLTVQNVSAHRPYDTPYGKSTDQMFSYVDKSLNDFYQHLKQNGFFKHGILIVVGDHRKMEPIEKDEFQKFGLSAKSRVAATVIGAGIHKNVINNTIFQHTDIYNSLKYLVGGDNTVVSTLFNDLFSFHTNRDWGIRYCRYADKLYVKVNKDGFASVLSDKPEDLPLKEYIQAYKGFQAEKLLGLTGLNDYDTPKTLLTSGSVTLIAHGGGIYNKWSLTSLNSAMRARKDGASGLQLDVSYTKDHKSVIFRGPSLKDTICGAKKNISDYPLDKLQKECPFRNGEKVMTLEDFLSQTRGLFHIFFLDIHSYTSELSLHQLQDVTKIVERLGLQKNVVILSQDKTINTALSLDTHFLAGIYPVKSASGYLSPQEFYFFSGDSLKQEDLALVKAQKKKPVLYVLNKYTSLKNALLWGVDYIVTDNIPLAKKMISSPIK